MDFKHNFETRETFYFWTPPQRWKISRIFLLNEGVPKADIGFKYYFNVEYTNDWMRIHLWWLSDKLTKSFSLCEYCLWYRCDQPRLGFTRSWGNIPGYTMWRVTIRRIRRREEVALKFKLIRAKYWACLIQKVTAEKRNIKVPYPFSARNDFFLLLTLIGAALLQI